MKHMLYMLSYKHHAAEEERTNTKRRPNYGWFIAVSNCSPRFKTPPGFLLLRPTNPVQASQISGFIIPILELAFPPGKSTSEPAHRIIER